MEANKHEKWRGKGVKNDGKMGEKYSAMTGTSPIFVVSIHKLSILK